MKLSHRTSPIDVRGIEDPNQHSAAQTLLRLTRAGDHALTPRRLAQAETKLARGAVGAEAPFLVDQLERQLPALRALVDQAPSHRAPLPFTNTIGVEAIANDAARRCATALTSGLERPDVLTLAQVVEARAIVRDGPESTHPRASVVREALDAGLVTPAALEALETFLRSGQGGLVCHGPISVSGRVLNDVYRLPVHGGDVRAAIDAYEAKFGHTGYDRIYLQAQPEGGLYLALNDHGRISDLVKPGYRAALPEGSERSCALEVLHVVDVPNGFREAALGPWRDTVAKLGDAMAGALRGRASDGVERASTQAAAVVGGAPAPRARVSDLVNLGTAFGGLTAVGTAVCLSELALPVALSAAGATAIISGVNVATWARNQGAQNKTAIAHALGIAVNQARTDII
jgi:hypothetical protein